MALTGIQEDAEDLLHTGLERALKQNLSHLENKNAFLRTIMRNFWYDELRKKKVRAEHVVSQLSEENNATPINEPDANAILIDHIQLERSWSQLQDQQRELLYLWCILGMTAAEMAEELDLPRGTVLSRLHRLRQQLQSEKIIQDKSEVQHD